MDFKLQVSNIVQQHDALQLCTSDQKSKNLLKMIYLFQPENMTWKNTKHFVAIFRCSRQ